MNKLLTVILAGLAMVGPLAIDTYLPSFPAIRQGFGIGEILVQQTLSLFLFCFALMMLFYGTLSDSFGRRPVILVSLAVYTAASIGAAFAPSIGWLLVCRALQGLSAGAGSVVGRAIVRDRFSGADAQRMLSYIMMMFGLAPAIAPILGGWLQVWFGWRSVFLFLSAFGCLMFLACWRVLQESLPRSARHAFHLGAIARSYWRALRNPQFIALALAMGFVFGGFSLYIGSAANFVMGILGLGATGFGWMFIPAIAGMVAGSALAARRAGVPARRSILTGYSVMAAATLLNVGYNALFQAAVPWAVLPLFVHSFGMAMMSPAVTLRVLDLFPRHRGLASSLQSFLQMMTFAAMSGLVAPLLFDSALKLALGMAGSLALSLSCYALAQRARARGKS